MFQEQLSDSMAKMRQELYSSKEDLKRKDKEIDLLREQLDRRNRALREQRMKLIDAAMAMREQSKQGFVDFSALKGFVAVLLEKNDDEKSSPKKFTPNLHMASQSFVNKELVEKTRAQNSRIKVLQSENGELRQKIIESNESLTRMRGELHKMERQVEVAISLHERDQHWWKDGEKSARDMVDIFHEEAGMLIMGKENTESEAAAKMRQAILLLLSHKAIFQIMNHKPTNFSGAKRRTSCISISFGKRWQI